MRGMSMSAVSAAGVLPVGGVSVRGASERGARARNAGAEGESGGPVVRLRYMLFGVCALVVFIAGPLGLVWKQSYIDRLAKRIEAHAVALDALNGEIKSLRLQCNRLSEPERVERVARARGLEYPASGQIVVLEVEAPRRDRGVGGLIARITRFVSGA